MKSIAPSFESPHFPTWCPGCGDFAIWAALKNALANLGLSKDETVIVYGIGCSGNMTNFMDVYGFHGLHGRPIPVAVGVKLANHKLPVIVIAGDGDTFGEGTNHFLHAARANADITVIVHDNQIYGLTTGQTSPTSAQGTVSKTTPSGSVERPFHPLALALTGGATHVSRGFSGDIPHLTSLFEAAIRHKGFSFIDVFQPCVTFNKVNTYAYFRERVVKLEEGGYTPHDRMAAMKKVWDQRKLPIGVFYEEQAPAHHEQLAVLKEKTLLAQAPKKRDIAKLLQQLT